LRLFVENENNEYLKVVQKSKIKPMSLEVTVDVLNIDWAAPQRTKWNTSELSVRSSSSMKKPKEKPKTPLVQKPK